MKPRTAVCLLGLLLSWWGTFPAHADPLVTTGSTWKYFKGRTEASTPDTTAWRNLSFDDTIWESGPATFYYGENFTGTLFSDMQNNYSTVFLRQKFIVKIGRAHV